MVKRKIGLLYGGHSVEHEISVRSAMNIETHIDKEQFEVFPIGICKKGSWRYTQQVKRAIDNGEELQLNLNPEDSYFITSGGEKIDIDIMFVMLHGTDGEDGSVQGLLNTAGIPMIGSGVLGSAIAMNKLVAKQLMQQAELPVVKFIHYRFDERKKIQFEAIRSTLGLPFMVKAVNLGSSIGVSLVKKEADMEYALAHAFRYDTSIMVEEYIQGREIECGVLGNNPPRASMPGEIIINKEYDFYTFNAKYIDPEAVRIDMPAQLEIADIARIKRLSVDAFKVLHCNDFARIDLFLGDDGHCYINEVNTIPGFTDASMFPLMWINEKLSFGELITRLILLSLKRHSTMSSIKKEFNPSQKDEEKKIS